MRRLRTALLISIFANIFLVGALIGGTAWLGSRRAMISAGALRIAGSELPRDERKAFRFALRQTRAAMQPTLVAGRKARADAARLLRQPALDQAALVDALTRLRTADMTMRAAIEQRAVVFAATLPPADRAHLAEAMERAPRSGHGSRFGH